VDVAALVVLCTAAGGLLIAGWMHLDRLDASVRHPGLPGREAAPPATPDQRDDPGASSAPADPDEPEATTVLAGPPLVAEDDGATTTLRDWLVHFHPDRDNAWVEVTREFCDTMAVHPDVAGYFPTGQPDALQKHFLAALILITGTGLSAAGLERIRAYHAGVQDGHGRGITPRAYDTAMRILLDLLRAKNIPDSALGELMISLYLVGQVVVTAPDPS
jgi:hypothetical protein